MKLEEPYVAIVWLFYLSSLQISACRKPFRLHLRNGFPISNPERHSERAKKIPPLSDFHIFERRVFPFDFIAFVSSFSWLIALIFL